MKTRTILLAFWLVCYVMLLDVIIENPIDYHAAVIAAAIVTMIGVCGVIAILILTTNTK